MVNKLDYSIDCRDLKKVFGSKSDFEILIDLESILKSFLRSNWSDDLSNDFYNLENLLRNDIDNGESSLILWINKYSEFNSLEDLTGDRLRTFSVLCDKWGVTII